MKAIYSRVSTSIQNPERQLQRKGFDYVFTDYCSGLIPFQDRPKGKQIWKLIEEGKVNELHIHSIDRLGRDLMSTLTVWNDLTSRGVVIICSNPTLRNINENGKVDKFSELIMSILSTMSSFEKDLIKERQLEGIKLRKAKNLYMGRQIGTRETPQKLLQKEKSKRILEYLSKGNYSYTEIAKIIGCSPTTIVKVKKVAEMACN